MEKIFAKGKKDATVVITIKKQEELIRSAVATVKRDSSLSMSFDLSVFFGDDAEYGRMAVYTISVKPLKGGS